MGRKERDTMGEIEVPETAYWGAQTARSLIHFSLGGRTMPEPVIHAFGLLKKAAAKANCELGLLPPEKCDLIVLAAEEVADGTLKDHFPLRIWQTGSGTQTNMNVNEVIANRAIELAGGVLGSKDPIHPNDHVNLSQSSNDTFPTVMHMAAVFQLTSELFPSVEKLRNALELKSQEFADVVKTGRTHLMDATPVTLGQEFSGYVNQLDQNLVRLKASLTDLYHLAIGGTAVGTGINAPTDFGPKVAALLAKETGYPFAPSSNTFASLAAHDPIVFTHGALKTLATSLFKITSDLAWMGSGPRCGLSELIFPENEPGSSIMPGKVNPTQCEALQMICAHVFGSDVAISIGGSRGNFELNVFKPMMIHHLLESIELLAQGCSSFTDHFVTGLKPNHKQLELMLDRSLMLATALAPKIGYDRAAKVAKKAHLEGCSLSRAASDLGYLTEIEAKSLLDPLKMTKTST